MQDLSGARSAPMVQTNGWFNLSTSGQCDWPYRKSITIDHTHVASPGQSSFPVLISVTSDPDLSAHARPDGNDLLFTSADGVTKLSHEIESLLGGHPRSLGERPRPSPPRPIPSSTSTTATCQPPRACRTPRRSGRATRASGTWTRTLREQRRR